MLLTLLSTDYEYGLYIIYNRNNVLKESDVLIMQPVCYTYTFILFKTYCFLINILRRFLVSVNFWCF